MSTAKPTTDHFRSMTFMDALLYLVAGSAMVFISITFLLWLRY